MIKILLTEVRRSGATLLAVTHDAQLIAAVETVYRLDHGRLERTR